MVEKTLSAERSSCIANIRTTHGEEMGVRRTPISVEFQAIPNNYELYTSLIFSMAGFPAVVFRTLR